MSRKLSKYEFVEKSILIHDNKYDYSKFEYVNSKTKSIITCPIHGDFEQSPSEHLLGKGCPKCGRVKTANSKRLNTELFINKCSKIHNNKYDYSKTKYEISTKPVIVTCPIHGDFNIIAVNHLRGYGCPKCGREHTNNVNRKSLEQFIFEAKLVHKNKYSYEHAVYKNSKSKIVITCPIHGDFEQVALEHLHGSGCPKCVIDSKRDTFENFVSKARIIHGDKYIYKNNEYVSSQTNITITCPIHGDFEQKPNNHLNGSGCPYCANMFPKIEQEIFEFVKSICDDAKLHVRNIIKKEIDIFIPSKNIAIEIDGLFWHCEINKDKNYHLSKTNLCESKGIRLIHIFEDEWLCKKEIVKSRLKSILGKSENKEYARNTTIVEVDASTARKFFDKNHIQGFVGSQFYYALKNKNCEIVAMMSFGKLRKNLGNENKNGYYELTRFCNKLNYNVIGGASKLLKNFIKNKKPKHIISYADRRWSVGDLYTKIGFELSNISPPSYFYIIGKKRINRFEMRKDVLVSKYGCKPEETEHSFCFKNGWYRIYDCGTKVYDLKTD